MASTLKRRATYEDLARVPDHQVAEIVDGDLHASPRPTSRHAAAASGLGSQVWTAFHHGQGGPGGWWILFEPELHLGQDVAARHVKVVSDRPHSSFRTNAETRARAAWITGPLNVPPPPSVHWRTSANRGRSAQGGGVKKKAKSGGQRERKGAMKDLTSKANPKGGSTGLQDCLISGFQAPPVLKTQTQK